MTSVRRTLVLTAAVLVGCFSEANLEEEPCTPGAQISCDCPVGEGVQVCRMSGDGYEPCQCGDGTSAGTVTSDSATSTSGPVTSTSGPVTSTSHGTIGDSTGGAGSDDTDTTSTTATSTSGGSTTGDPGTTTGSVETDVVINELVHDPVSGQEDWIELYNGGTEAVDVSGWLISDGGNNFAIPQGTILDADDYLVYTRNQGNTFTWGFGDDELALLYNARGEVVDTADWQLGEATEPDSFGRLPNGSGPFQELTPTKGSANE